MAARVGELRKPNVTAWTINQLARTRELDVQRLLKAGEQLRQAQTEAILGEEGGGGFSAARRDEQAAVRRLTEAAREVLEQAGRAASEATLQRIGTTFRAAAVSDEGRELLKSGRLVDEVQPQGFDAFASLSFPARPRRARETRADARTARGRPAPAKPPKPAVDRRLEQARARVLEARSEARELTRQAEEAERGVERLERELGQAAAAAAKLRERARRAEERLERAEEEVRRLR